MARVDIGGVSNRRWNHCIRSRAEGNWQIQASNTSQFRGRVRKNITGSWVNTANFSNQDLSGAYRLFALELDRTNQTLSSWLDGVLNDYKLPDPVPLRDNRRFSIMGNRGRNQPTAGSVAEVIGISSVLEEDRIRIQNYLARKWSLPIGQNLGYGQELDKSWKIWKFHG